MSLRLSRSWRAVVALLGRSKSATRCHYTFMTTYDFWLVFPVFTVSASLMWPFYDLGARAALSERSIKCQCFKYAFISWWIASFKELCSSWQFWTSSWPSSSSAGWIWGSTSGGVGQNRVNKRCYLPQKWKIIDMRLWSRFDPSFRWHVESVESQKRIQLKILLIYSLLGLIERDKVSWAKQKRKGNATKAARFWWSRPVSA